MRGSRRRPAVAPHPSEDGGLRVCIDVPGLNRAASQERLWPSRVGQAPDVRAGAGCLAVREWPDVRGTGRMSELKWQFESFSG